VVTQWLLQLQEHHPSFTRTGENPIMIDHERLLQLPENDLVHDRIREIVHEQLEEQEPDILAQGPQDDSLPVNEGEIQNPMMSHAAIPNLMNNMSEFEQLCPAAATEPSVPPEEPPPAWTEVMEEIVLTAPAILSAPLNEKLELAIDVFPSLFPEGIADLNAPRALKVNPKEWAGHLMHYKGGRFARHPRFCYWIYNTRMRDAAKKTSTYYQNQNQNDALLSIEDIREMIANGNIKELADRVSCSASQLEGTQPFWNRERRLLSAMIGSPEVKSPNVFFTVSSADIQWLDMHQHMPEYDINEPENAQSYKQHMENLNNNPAIASYYFRKHW